MTRWPWPYASQHYAEGVVARDAYDAEMLRRYPNYVVFGKLGGLRSAKKQYGRQAARRARLARIQSQLATVSYHPPLSNVTYSPE